MRLNEKEIESVSSLKPFDRYKYFIKRVADFEEVWTILDQDGDIALSDIDDEVLVSFWSSEEYIGSNLSQGWKDCKPLKLTLEDFEEKVLPFIHKEQSLVNVFPVGGKSGFVVSIEEFLRDLNEELEQY